MGKSSPNLLCQFGLYYMLEQTKRLVDEIPGVQLGRDIEAIHQMRVASRRLSTALDVFKPCLPKKKSKDWRDATRKVTIALGNARDLDIQIAQLTKAYTDQLDARFKPGYNRLLLRLKQKRTKAQKKVNKTVFKLNESEALEEMILWFEKTIEPELLTDTYPPSIYHKSHQAITNALNTFLRHQDFIASDADSDKLHAMRIAGKRLRYTMEIFAPLYADDLKPFIIVMKDIQTQLGEFHDSDVWVSWLPKFVDKEKGRIEEYFGNTGPLERLMPGIHYLMDVHEQARINSYETFLLTWQTLADDDAWLKLRAIIEPPDLPVEEELEDEDEMDEAEEEIEGEIEGEIELTPSDELPEWIEEEVESPEDAAEEHESNPGQPDGIPASDPAPTRPATAIDSDEDTSEIPYIDLTDQFPTDD